MDLRKYDKLRGKLRTKDFEGKNKNLDKWSYRASFFGNFISIFFAFFLIYPSLKETISLQVIDGFWGEVISFIATSLFLVLFESIKRFLIRNFSFDFVSNNQKLKTSIIGWFGITMSVIALSFYLSISGSKEFASVSKIREVKVEENFEQKKDSVSNNYEAKIDELNDENIRLSNDIDKLWEIHNDQPDNHYTRKDEIRDDIDDKGDDISDNRDAISDLESERKNEINELEEEYNNKKSENRDGDFYYIIIFVIIVVFNEFIIVFGIYFREYYEYMLYVINNKRFEKVYLKRDRYRSLLSFIYGEGKLDIGDKVISGLELKEIVEEKTNIQNSKKFVDEFLRDMDNLGVFTINGKRRHIAVTYHEALTIIENFDDAHRILENMK